MRRSTCVVVLLAPHRKQCACWAESDKTHCLLATIRGPGVSLYPSSHSSHCSHTCPEELYDWRGQDKRDNTLSAASKKVYRGRLASFLDIKKRAANRAPVPKLLKTRLANKWGMSATDQLLRDGAGSGVQDFVEPWPCKRLSPNEERYYVECSDLPAHIQGASIGRSRRACIFNSETGDSRLETLWGAAQRVLIEHSDEGSATFPGKMWLFAGGACHIRGWFFFTTHPTGATTTATWLCVARA